MNHIVYKIYARRAVWLREKNAHIHTNLQTDRGRKGVERKIKIHTIHCSVCSFIGLITFMV